MLQSNLWQNVVDLNVVSGFTYDINMRQTHTGAFLHQYLAF